MGEFTNFARSLFWKSNTVGHGVVISYFVGVGWAVELLRLGDNLQQGATKDRSSRAEVQRVGRDFTAERPFNINGKE